MAMIVELGLGLVAANSYSTTQDADAYHADRGNTAWLDLDSDVKQACLIKATDYMMQVYRGTWKGVRSYQGQALDWPRSNVRLADHFYDYVRFDQIPREVKQACAELALRASKGELLADQQRSTVQEQVGSLSVTYDKASPQQTRFVAIDALLTPFLITSGVSTRLVRT